MFKFIPKYLTLFDAIVNGIVFALCILKSYIDDIIKYLYIYFSHLFHHYYGTWNISLLLWHAETVTTCTRQTHGTFMKDVIPREEESTMGWCKEEI